MRGDEEETVAKDNGIKAKLFYEEFFLEPPKDDEQQTTQGAACWKHQHITNSQI